MKHFPTGFDRFRLRCILGATCGVVAIAFTTSQVRGQCSPQEQTKLIASDAAKEDEFGYAVSVSGNTAVVGAYWDDDACPGDASCNSGTAYVFVRSGTDWTFQQKLTAFDAAKGDYFGSYLGISGDTIVVGSPYDDDACPMNPSCNSGSAYVFVRTGTLWTFQQKLIASDAAEGDSFGDSIGISGDTIVVGAETDDNAGGANAGSAYVFVGSGGMWSEQKKLIASDAAANDKFGYSAAISGDTVVIGAVRDDTAGGVNSGSAYVFVRSGTNWFEQKQLIASDGAKDDSFGYCVAVSGDTAVVGAWADDDACPLDALCNSGSAYVYVRSGADWTQQQKLIPSDGAKDDNFGTSVGVSGETIVIGSPYDDNAGGNNAGSAFLYVRTGAVWNLQQKLFASDAATDDYFGQSAAMSGDTVVIGADGDDHSSKTSPGSAYPFNLGCDDDGDGVADINDGCPADANKSGPGDCGCGVADVDANGNGVSDCLDGAGGCCAPGAAPTVGVITPLVMLGWKIRRRRSA